MALSSAFLDELRARTSLSGLIGGAVKLTRAGREWKGCCPFHQEKTPSFTVNDGKGFYHCFGCGAHGDAIRWLTDHGGLPFIDAVKQLADAAGMDVPAPSPEAAQRAARIDGIRPALEAAQALYVRELEQAGQPREYLHGRGISEATIEAFGLGWAPARRGHLSAIGITLDAALSAGLAWQGDGRSGETFHLRVMVPVHDARGRIVGFGGRALQHGSTVPKYKNSPDSEIFDKGRILFNYHRAAIAVRRARPAPSPIAGDSGAAAGAQSRAGGAGRLIIVEGYMDVIALTQAGIAEAVAPMGTALTPAQLVGAWRLCQRPVLAMDGDKAGRAAARRACETALPFVGPGRELAIAILPEGKDPDDVVREGGAEAFEACLAGAQALSAHLFDCVAADMAERSPEAVAAAWAKLDELAASIADPETQAQYRAAWRGRFDAELSLNRSTAAAPRLVIVRDDGADDGEDDAGDDDTDGDLTEFEQLISKGSTVEPDSESARQLQMIIKRVLALRAERRGINEEIKSAMAIAKALGFVKPQITATVRDIEADPILRQEGEAIHASYRRAMGVSGPMTEAVLPAIGTEAMQRAARVADKRMAKTLAMLDLPAPAPARLTDGSDAHG